MVTTSLYPQGPQRHIVDRQQLAEEQLRQKMLKMVLWLENKLTVLYAPKRSGKTTTMAMLAVWYKKLLHKRVVVVGSDMGLLPPFGKKEVMSIFDFVEQIKLLNEISRDKRVTETINNIGDHDVQKIFAREFCRNRGITVYDSLVLIDEMRKVSGRRKSTSKLNRLMNDFYMQMGHWWVTIIGSVPKWIDLDNYTLEQLDWRGEVSRNEFTHEVYVDFRGKTHNFDIAYDGSTYYKFFNSRAMLGIADSSLNLTDDNV